MEGHGEDEGEEEDKEKKKDETSEEDGVKEDEVVVDQNHPEVCWNFAHN